MKRISVRSTTIPFLKQASNSSIQTNLTTPTPESDTKISIEEHFNNNKVRLKSNGILAEKHELKHLTIASDGSLRESEEDKYLQC